MQQQAAQPNKGTKREPKNLTQKKVVRRKASLPHSCEKSRKIEMEIKQVNNATDMKNWQKPEESEYTV